MRWTCQHTRPPVPAVAQRAAWPHIIILVIFWAFVVVMTALGYAPEAAVGVAAAALAAASSATGRTPRRAER